MIMSRLAFRKTAFIAAIAMCIGINAGAQAFGSYAPYSIFGVGDISNPGTAYNKSMGGVGIANRNNRFINILNPAAVTARDSLAFMSDFSVYGDNKVFSQGNVKSASNTFNISDFAISFPIWRSSAMMFGLMPYSSTGYGYSFNVTDPSVIGHTGDIKYSALGQGGIYKLFLGAGATFWKRLSVGAQVNYHFGQNKKEYSYIFSDKSYNSVENGSTISINGLSGKIGVQYAQPIGKGTLTFGATYTTRTKLKGYIDTYSFSTGTAASDTLSYKADTLGTASGSKAYLASEIGVGISYRHGDRWMVEFDYTRSDWRNSNFEKVSGFSGNQTSGSGYSSFACAVADNFMLGFELTPNRNDIRYYFNTVSYRAGAYYKKEYYLFNGNPVYSTGITLGATFPIYRWYNGLTIAVDLGQRGSLKDSMIRERYVNFSLGFNLFDIWFRKHHYE